MKVYYQFFSNMWRNYSNCLQGLIIKTNARKICEVGGGANPYLPLDFIEKYNLEYTILDISAEELAKAPDAYHKLQADITSSNLKLDEKYDVIFSKMLAEHIKNGLIFHTNVFKLLRPGGYAFHFFPTLYALPFVINFFFPQGLTEQILLYLQPFRTREGKYSKFEAYYSWCRGPMKSQIEKLENLGYGVEEYYGFFGHDYYKKIIVLDVLHKALSSLNVKYPMPFITSYAQVLLKKN